MTAIPIHHRISAAIELLDFILSDPNPNAVSFFMALLNKSANPGEREVQDALQLTLDRFACPGCLQ